MELEIIPDETIYHEDVDSDMNENTSTSYSMLYQYLEFAPRVMFWLAMVCFQAATVACFWSHIFKKDFKTVFTLMIACFYINTGLFPVMCILCKASVPSYLICEMSRGRSMKTIGLDLDLDFTKILVIAVCGWKINVTFGCTMAAVLLQHHHMLTKQKKDKGKVTGFSSVDADEDADAVLDANNIALQAAMARLNTNMNMKMSASVNNTESGHEKEPDSAIRPITILTADKSKSNENVIEKYQDKEPMPVRVPLLAVDHKDDEKEEETGTKPDNNPIPTNTTSPQTKKKTSTLKTTKSWVVVPDPTDETETARREIVLKSKHEHPGLGGFHQWMGAISDIHRMYQIADTNEELSIPILSRSERGRVRLHMVITNKSNMVVDVYWINYKGHEVHKGSMRANGGIFDHTTLVGHPWVFRSKESGKALMHYVPYRIIPRIASDQTDQEEDVGSHRFAITNSSAIRQMCGIEDRVFPFPPSNIGNIHNALEFAIRQMDREQVSPRIILKYIRNILLHPEDCKYRQIRVSNGVFWNNIWCNGGRGVLHAIGFEEHGAHIEMGSSRTLPGDRIKDVSSAIGMLEEYLNDLEDVSKTPIRQPKGADGHGTGRGNWRL